MNNLNKRDSFGSKIGILAAAAGSAIGLGNIWKFPYIIGENGGAAFLIVYLVCIALIGLPVMLSEFVIGRKAQSNPVEAYKKIKPNTPWYLNGLAGVVTAFMVLSYYSVIAGWVFSYIRRSVSGALFKVAPEAVEAYFEGIISTTGEPIFWAFVVMAITVFIVISGIKDGVEKYSKILMPILLVLLGVLMVRSLTLPGAYKGVEFLFKPDFSKLSPKGVLEALGHAFFSLSLGMGAIMTYGSYVDKKENLSSLSLQVTIADTLIALMAGMVIFPALFALGGEPDAGPGLIFVTLPKIFAEMPLGGIFQTLFFILIGVAALTSTISLLEVVVTYFIEKFNWDRKKATILVGAIIFIMAIPSSLSFGAWSNVKVFGRNWFGHFDFLTSNVLMPLGGLLIAVFVGWAWGPEKAIQEATSEGKYKFKFENTFKIFIKYVIPVAIFIVFLNSVGVIDKILNALGLE